MPAEDPVFTKDLIDLCNEAARNSYVPQKDRRQLAIDAGVGAKQGDLWFGGSGKGGRALVPRTAKGKRLSALPPGVRLRAEAGLALAGEVRQDLPGRGRAVYSDETFFTLQQGLDRVAQYGMNAIGDPFFDWAWRRLTLAYDTHQRYWWLEVEYDRYDEEGVSPGVGQS